MILKSLVRYCAISSLLLFFCSFASAGEFYRIIDNNGNVITQTVAQAETQPYQASFTAAGVSTGISGAATVTECNIYATFLTPCFLTSVLSGRGCGIEPYPLAEYESDPAYSGCYSRAYAFGPPWFGTVPGGTPNCAPGTSPTTGNPCGLPFIFNAAPTAPGGLVVTAWRINFGSFTGPLAPCVEPDGSTQCTVYPPADGTTLDQPFVTLIYGPSAFTCQGFQSPADQPIGLTKKTNRAIPLKAQLFFASGSLVTPTNLNAAAPVVNVSYTSVGGTAVDDTSLLDSPGNSSSGNTFNFDPTTGTWWFNLATAPYTASGTYTVTLRTGDSTKYAVSSCSATFVRP